MEHLGENICNGRFLATVSVQPADKHHMISTKSSKQLRNGLQGLCVPFSWVFHELNFNNHHIKTVWNENWRYYYLSFYFKSRVIMLYSCLIYLSLLVTDAAPWFFFPASVTSNALFLGVPNREKIRHLSAVAPVTFSSCGGEIAWASFTSFSCCFSLSLPAWCTNAAGVTWDAR